MAKYARYDNPTWYLTANVLPPCEGEYIVTCRDAIRATVLYYEDGNWYNEKRKKFNVIAWMFLPGAYRQPYQD